MLTTMAAKLKEIREGHGKTQQQMADAMGMPLRSYQDIEGEKNPVRPIHMKAAAFAQIVFAAEGRGYDDLPFDLGELVARAARKT